MQQNLHKHILPKKAVNKTCLKTGICRHCLTSTLALIHHQIVTILPSIYKNIPTKSEIGTPIIVYH